MCSLAISFFHFRRHCCVGESCESSKLSCQISVATLQATDLFLREEWNKSFFLGSGRGFESGHLGKVIQKSCLPSLHFYFLKCVQWYLGWSSYNDGHLKDPEWRFFEWRKFGRSPRSNLTSKPLSSCSAKPLSPTDSNFQFLLYSGHFAMLVGIFLCLLSLFETRVVCGEDLLSRHCGNLVKKGQPVWLIRIYQKLQAWLHCRSSNLPNVNILITISNIWLSLKVREKLHFFHKVNTGKPL